ncbi:MAG TPA: hypothetical protein VLX92_22805, partial [Kofleriaceae bacterium]|nr:hypothetical protein [Kofleriaceae bacterium]
VAKAEIKNGKLELTKFQTTSKDGELHIDFTMKLEPSIMDSLVTGCLRFKGSEGLATREPKTFAALTTTGAEIRADGLFHIKLAETLRNMKRLNMECGPNAPQAGTGEFAAPPHGPPPRPVLTVPPPEPPRPVEPPPRAEIPHPIAGSAVPPSAPAGSGFAPAPGPAPAAGSGSAPPPMEGAPGSGSAPAEEQAGSGSNEQALPR